MDMLQGAPPSAVPPFPTAPSMPVQLPLQRVGFGPRLGAFVADAVLILILGAIIGLFFGSLLSGLFSGGISPGGGIALVLGSFIGFLYGILIVGVANLLLELFAGASLGKMILGLQIASADGSRAPLSHLSIRTVAKNIAFIGFVAAGVIHSSIINQIGGLLELIIILGAFMMLGSSRQALHDKIAGTAVFHRRYIAAASPSRTWVLGVGGGIVALILLAGVLLAGSVTRPSLVANSNEIQVDQSSANTVSPATNVAPIGTPVASSSTTQVPGQAQTGGASKTSSQSSGSLHISIAPNSGPENTKIVITRQGGSDFGNYSAYFGDGSSGEFYVLFPSNYPTSHPSNIFLPISASTFISTRCTPVDAFSGANCSRASGDLTEVHPGTYQIIVKNETTEQMSNAATFTITAQ